MSNSKTIIQLLLLSLLFTECSDMKNVAVWQLLDDVVSRELFQIIICKGYFRWLGLISAPDISARDILARTFHHWDFSAQGHFGTTTFWHGYISAPRRFWHRDIMALGHFGIRIFRHMDVSAHVHFGTLQSNIDICPVPK